MTTKAERLRSLRKERDDLIRAARIADHYHELEELMSLDGQIRRLDEIIEEEELED